MEFFRIRRDIPFMRHALVFNVISFLTFAAAVFFLVTRGLHLSIEFTGGTVLEVGYAQTADVSKVRTAVESMGFGEAQVQNFGTSRDVLIRLPIRGDMKQSDVAARMFEKLCSAEGGKLEQHVPSPAATAVNPVVLLEVTSDSSEQYDTGEKREAYQTIATLREYIVVSHRERRITLYRREDAGWKMRSAISGGRILVEVLDAELRVDEIYRNSSIS